MSHLLGCGTERRKPCNCGHSSPRPQDQVVDLYKLSLERGTTKAQAVDADPLFTPALLAEADALVQAWKRDPREMQGWVLDRMMRNLVLQDHLVTRTIPGRSGPIIQAKAFDRFGEMAEAVLAASAPPEAPKRKAKKKPEEEDDWPEKH